MKKVLALSSWIFLFTFMICTVVKAEAADPTQEVEKNGTAVVNPIDLSGTWIMTDDWSGCKKKKVEKWTVEITQSGNKIKLFNVDRNHNYTGMINNNIISVNGFEYPSPSAKGATNTIHDYILTIGQSGDILTGKAKWTWKSKKGFTCGGLTDLTLNKKTE